MVVYCHSKLAYANRQKYAVSAKMRAFGDFMNLKNAELGIEYTVRAIETNDEELDSFLFSLGCYIGQPITVISRQRSSSVVAIKDGRYSIDNRLAEAISVC